MTELPIVRRLRDIANKSGHGNTWAVTADAADLICELVKALEWYADQFCEYGDDEGCGEYEDATCAGCRARAILTKARSE
jgi:hypothetical protein